jgi:hypothetical protein
MKIINLVEVLLLGASVSFADPLPPSESFIVFDSAGQGILQILYGVDGGPGVIFRNGVVTPAPPEGSLILSGIAGNPSRVNSPTVLLDPDGSVSDIFGVFLNPANGGLEVGFVSDVEGSPFPILPPIGAVSMPEPPGPVDVTQYLDPGLQLQGYTARFSSDTEVPDVGNTGCLLGLACLCLSLLRPKCPAG